MFSEITSVGIIANPSAGKDIRRLVAQGRFVPNHEKINILKRVFVGLQAAGVKEVLMMPDMAGLGRSAMDDESYDFSFEFLDMPVFNDELDTIRASRMMAERGVGCLVTLGGDGTNRATARHSGEIPLVPISTGTNNVFPYMVEGTLAGLAAGVIATRSICVDKAVIKSKAVEVYIDDEYVDIALVDVAISKEIFVGSRAIWNMDTLHELILTRAEPSSIGLSAIGAQITPTYMDDDRGIHITFPDSELGITSSFQVRAPTGPGVISSVDVSSWKLLQFGDRVEINLLPCTVALDGERSISVRPNQKGYLVLTRNGPPVVSIDAALREAAKSGIFTSGKE